MVDAILLILREVLEAALIITMLLVMSRKLSIALSWILPALALGMLSSWILAHYASAIADMFYGTGQEWVNALLYLSVILSFIVIASTIAPLLFSTPSAVKYLPRDGTYSKPYRTLIFCAVLAVGLSLAREVAEIWIYVGGFLHQPDLLQSAIIGGAIGFGIGTSLGVITYYLLVFISARTFLSILFFFLILLCGGLSMQIARQLLQIGVLNSAGPLWDSSSVVNEHSWLGELLYALIGYDSSPNAVQVIFFTIAILPLLLLLLGNLHRRNRKLI